MAADPFEHVLDTPHWHLFETQGVEFHLPFGLTKFMVLELIAAGLMLAIFIPIARRVRTGEPPRGVFWNAFEFLLTFIRDSVAKPYLDRPGHDAGHGEHHEHAPSDADRFVPFLWTIFLFVLFCNLLGMFPFLGSPTASLSVTGALALCSFVVIHGAPIIKMGPVGYLKSYLPHIDVPFGMGVILVPAIAAIEIVGHFIKGFVLAVRLFANMVGGHTVLAVILLFIVMAKDAGIFIAAPVTIFSVLGVTALSLLELFVAFLQAFIFTFLTTIFLSMTLHPAH